MSLFQRAFFVPFLLLVGAGACGGQREVALKAVSEAPAVTPGPPATPEELSGDMPPLRGLADVRPLVPPELIPPEAPPDPNPGFDGPK